MRLVATTRLKLGMVLGQDVVNDVHGRIPLLRAGVKITENYRQALLDAGIHAVYVDDELGAGIEVTRALSEQTRQTATRALVRSFSAVPALAAEGKTLSETAVDELTAVAELICRDLANADDAVLALSDLAAADQYTLQHSIDTTALGVLIARHHFRRYGRPAPGGKRRLDSIDRQLTKLGVGLLLHDIGKLTIPHAVLRKQGALDDEERAIMRTHTMAGLALLPGDMVGPLAKSVIRSHHERWDGSGYTQGLAGHDIPEFARIAAVADVFDAITSERPYAGAQPPHLGVRTIVEGSGVAFDPTIVKTFRQVVAPYPPGSEIVLADGCRAVVVSVPPQQLDLPLVRVIADPLGQPVTPHELDLREQPELSPPEALSPAA